MPYKAAQKEYQSVVCKHDIGSPGQPRYINLSSHLSADQCSEYWNLMKQFADVFAWEYSDLKTYDKKIIQHKNPSRERHHTFQTEAETNKSYASSSD